MARDSRIVPSIGDIYLVQFHGDGHVQRGFRPAVVFQNNAGNRRSPNIVVLPITSSIKKEELPTHVFLQAEESGLKRDGIVLCENPVTVPKTALRRLVSKLTDEAIKKVAYANLLASSAISYLDTDELLKARELAVSFNAKNGTEIKSQEAVT
jgi:mRNA interferase MazF